MRITILLSVLIAAQAIYGQTDSIEKAILYNKVLSEEISTLEFNAICKKWNKAIKKNKYPNLPVNSSGKIQYSFIKEFQGISKDKLFNRILEWFSITYGIIPANLYTNPEDGKIICSNRINIYDNTSGTFTCILTIKDEKILVEFTNIGYQVTRRGYYSGNIWIPEKTNYYNLDQVFPIILKAPAKWTYYFGIVNALNEHFSNDINSLNDYINNYDLRYHF